jgi:hypothetical protein
MTNSNIRSALEPGRSRTLTQYPACTREVGRRRLATNRFGRPSYAVTLTAHGARSCLRIRR